MKEYNGYRSYSAWNQSLWLSNDYDLEMQMREWKDEGLNQIKVFNRLWQDLKGTRTGDGVKFNQRSVKEFISDWMRG